MVLITKVQEFFSIFFFFDLPSIYRYIVFCFTHNDNASPTM